MRPRSRAFLLQLGLAVMAAASPALWAQPFCPTLSVCSYQAGRPVLPEREAASPTRRAAPEIRPPVILNSCDAGGCLDPEASRYNASGANSGAGVYLDPQGRRCVRSGDWLQCG